LEVNGTDNQVTSCLHFYQDGVRQLFDLIIWIYCSFSRDSTDSGSSQEAETQSNSILQEAPNYASEGARS
jgi:hypothetical protein